jgi:hypothetical protein
MDTIQGRTLESLRTVRTFLNTHADRFPGIVDSGASKKLDALVVDLENHVSVQSGSTLESKGATEKHASQREALLRDHMAPIAKIAISELPDTPELKSLRMPRNNLSIERLRATALGMAQAAAPFADVFVKAGLPPDFIPQLVAAANATVETIGKRKLSRVAVGGATKGLKTTLSSARKTVHALDALVKSALKDDASLLAAWNVAKRVEKVSGAPSVLTQATSAPTQVAAPVASSTPAVTPAADRSSAAPSAAAPIAPRSA